MDDSERRLPRWLPWRSRRGERPADAGADRARESQPGPAPGRETALITGCDSPVGYAAAERFAAAGWRVYAAGPDPDALTGLADAGCETATLDVTADANVAGVVRRVLDGAGRIDCLVAGPGAGRLRPVEDLPTDDLAGEVDGTLLGAHRLVRRVLPHMRERGSGTVVTVASALGRVGVPGAAGVCAPAAALATATEALRGEVAPFGVDVVLVETAPVRGRDAGARDDGAAASDGGVAGEGRATRTVESGEAAARTDAYASLYDTLDDALALGPALGSVPPERVADAVLNAATCADPPPRYGVGRAAGVARVAALLPPRWRDRAFGLLRRLA